MSGEVSIIFGSTVGFTKGVICFVDADEAVGRGGIIAVVVWVVTFGKHVELTVVVLAAAGINMNMRP